MTFLLERSMFDISIHDLTRRSTVPKAFHALCGSISIHDLTRRSTYTSDHQYGFQDISIHDLTRRSTVAPNHNPAPFSISIHDLTRRSTLHRLFLPEEHHYFNSRPHKEVDMCQEKKWVYNNISIHDLTRRSTVALDSCTDEVFISIHDLTRRSTWRLMGFSDDDYDFNSRPHKEVDMLSVFDLSLPYEFQFTTSQGGRPNTIDGLPVAVLFQFTTSQGGRLIWLKY